MVTLKAVTYFVTTLRVYFKLILALHNYYSVPNNYFIILNLKCLFLFFSMYFDYSYSVVAQA